MKSHCILSLRQLGNVLEGRSSALDRPLVGLAVERLTGSSAIEAIG